MTAMRFSGKIKMPRPHGEYKAQKLKLRPGGDPTVDGDWKVVEEQDGNNVVLDQCMQYYFSLFQSTGLTGSQSSPVSFGANIASGHTTLFTSLIASDDTTATSAATTVIAGNTVLPALGNTAVTDAGDIGGREYTKVSKEVIFYEGQLTNGYTFNKLYGRVYQGIWALDNEIPNNSPISEILLASPITVNDTETEAVKLTYDIYFPRFGTLANADFGKESAGTGSITVQEKDKDGNTTTGATINWEMFWYGSRAGKAAFDSDIAINSLSTALIDTDDVKNCGVDTIGDGETDDSKAMESRSLVRSTPTATSVKFEYQDKIAVQGNVDTSFDVWGLTLGEGVSSITTDHGMCSPCAIFFDQAINVDWTQSLEIHADITLDWS